MPAGARGGQRRRRQLGVRRGAVVGERDLRAALAQAERDGAAEAPGASRHEHAGARDVHRAQPPSSVEPEAADDRLDGLLEVEPGLRRDLLGAAPAAEERPGDEVERHDLRQWPPASAVRRRPAIPARDGARAID